MAATLSLLVFVILPGSLYLGNLDEFMTAPAPIAQLLLLPALLFIAILMVTARLTPRKGLGLFSSVLAALTLLAWTQSYLLVWDYGVLDGSPIDWHTPAWRGWADLSVWSVGLTAAIVFHRRLERPLTTGALVIVALQAAMVVGDGFVRRDALALKATNRLAANELDAMARFSPTRNALHIVLDSFQADVFHEIVTGAGGAEVQAALPGFTFFEEHLGTFTATYLALPVIVSGQIYRNHVPLAEFMESAFAGKSILNAAHHAGFEVDLATDPLMLDLLMKGRFDNAYLTAQLPLAQEAAKLLDLALFRLTPHWLKPLVYNDQRWLTQRVFTRSWLLRFPYFTHNAFLAGITRSLATDRQAPVYKFFHLQTTHAPFVVNPDCSFAGRVLDRTRETVTIQSRCSLGFVIALLNRMKEAGIYDGSLIVLMGDHGGQIPPYRYVPGSIVERNMRYLVRPDFVALATPLLAVKPPGATGPFRISSAFTSMTDVAATIDALLGLRARMPGTSIWDQAHSPAVTRRFYGYEWSRMDPVSEYIAKIQEHAVSGSPYQLESWHMGPIFLPPEAQ